MVSMLISSLMKYKKIKPETRVIREMVYNVRSFMAFVLNVSFLNYFPKGLYKSALFIEE